MAFGERRMEEQSAVFRCLTGQAQLARMRKGEAMKFEIRRVQNGAVLRVEADYPDAETEEIVYQEMEADEIEAFAEFLRCLVEHYGPQTSRYSPKRIYISVEPGDKYEAPANGA